MLWKFSRLLPHEYPFSLYFPSTGYEINVLKCTVLRQSLKLGTIRNEFYFCGFYQCVNYTSMKFTKIKSIPILFTYCICPGQ